MNEALIRFYKACNPSKTLNLGNPEDRKYYIDFSEVRGAETIKEMARRITRLAPDEPTCQLFTGHIGCGKTTELLLLKQQLEEEKFHVVYFEATDEIDIGDVDVSDILLSIARRVSQSLEAAQIRLQPIRFQQFLQGAVDILNSDVTGLNLEIPEIQIAGAGIKIPEKLGFKSEEENVSLSFGIGEITMKAKESPKIRDYLRQYTESRIKSILDQINQELLQPAQQQLKRKGKKGLVVIIDNLDRVEYTQKPNGHFQPEYLFVDRGEPLKGLQCHLVYTIPLVLTFANQLEMLTNRFGGQPKILPMVRVRTREGKIFEKGMDQMRQMVLARAFPDLDFQHRLELIKEVFDSPETLDRLCIISGGHVRNLILLLYNCLEKEDLPISHQCLEEVIRERRDMLKRAITPDEWKLLAEVEEEKWMSGEEKYQTLIPGLFVFEYKDNKERWFRINPFLEELQNRSD